MVAIVITTAPIMMITKLAAASGEPFDRPAGQPEQAQLLGRGGTEADVTQVGGAAEAAGVAPQRRGGPEELPGDDLRHGQAGPEEGERQPPAVGGQHRSRHHGRQVLRRQGGDPGHRVLHGRVARSDALGVGHPVDHLRVLQVGHAGRAERGGHDPEAQAALGAPAQGVGHGPQGRPAELLEEEQADHGGDGGDEPVPGS